MAGLLLNSTFVRGSEGNVENNNPLSILSAVPEVPDGAREDFNLK
jgi:hypothetical protein